MTIDNKRQSLVSSRLRDKRRKLGITLYAVPSDDNVYKKATQSDKALRGKKVDLPKFFLIESNNVI